jgi:membrane protein YdbS with pleckstrin-like domain
MSRAEESEQEQLTRNLNELLQEVRVAQAGVQILFGFLLSIAFTDRYAKSGVDVKAIHLFTVLFAVIAVALLIAPVAYHRMLFRLGRREEIIEVSDRLAQAGLISLALAMSGTVLLLTQVAIGPWASIPSAVLIALGFAVLWFVFPARRRRRGPRRERVQPSQPNPP